jgi:uncharacterized protein
MGKKPLSVLAGFIVLFSLYHAAEYMIVFKNSAVGFLAFQLLFFVAAWLIGRWQSGNGLAAWGLDFGKRLGKHLLLGMVMGIVLYGATFGISVGLGLEKVTEVPALAAVVTPLSLFVFGNFFSSFSEDVLTRGYVYHHLYGRVGSWLLVLISASVYLLNHIYRLGDGIETHLYLFALGVLFVIPLLLTRRLWFTGGLHWAGNVTFYFTHEILKAEETGKGFSPNYVLIGVILLLIPLNYFLLRKLNLVKATEKSPSLKGQRQPAYE